MNAANTLPQILAPAFAGLLLVTFGSYRALYLAAAVVTISGVAFVRAIRSVR
jgi:hypothetical protein